MSDISNMKTRNKTKERLAAVGMKNTSEHLTGHHMTVQDELPSESEGKKRIEKNAHIKPQRFQLCTWALVGTDSNRDHMSIRIHHSCHSNHSHTCQLHIREPCTHCNPNPLLGTPNVPGILGNCGRWTCTKMCSPHTAPC